MRARSTRASRSALIRWSCSNRRFRRCAFRHDRAECVKRPVLRCRPLLERQWHGTFDCDGAGIAALLSKGAVPGRWFPRAAGLPPPSSRRLT
jgi:hypothetical protein